jgi:hypothetical protein
MRTDSNPAFATLSQRAMVLDPLQLKQQGSCAYRSPSPSGDLLCAFPAPGVLRGPLTLRPAALTAINPVRLGTALFRGKVDHGTGESTNA